MKKSASAGIKVAGILIIIGSLLSLSGFFIFHNTEGLDTFNIIRPAAFYFSIIISVFLFRLKNWARLAIVVISLLLLIETTIAAEVMLNNIEVRSGAWQKDFDKDTEKQLEKVKWSPMEGIGVAGASGLAEGFLMMCDELMSGAASFFLTVVTVLSGLFNIIVVFFFTRRGVAQQFQ